MSPPTVLSLESPTASAPSDTAPAVDGLLAGGTPEGLPPATVWLRRTVLANGWIAEIRSDEPSSGRSLAFAPEAGLTMTWPAPAARVRLSAPIALDRLSETAAGHLLAVRVALGPDDEAPQAVEWVAVLEIGGDEKAVFFHKIADGRAFAADGTLSRTVQTPAFDRRRRYTLTCQFAPGAGRVSVRELSLSDGRKPERPAGERVVSAPPVSSDAGADGRETTDAAAAPVRRRKAVVVCWDLGHNPAGRAFVLAELLAADHDVELVGPLFDRYGGRLWPPLADAGLRVRTFPARAMDDFLRAATAVVAEIDADVVYVCKPRLPGIVLGLLFKHRCGCPVILDVDDHELAFFPARTRLPLDALDEPGLDPSDLALPFGETWTRICETLVPTFDAVTVSNVALAERFGGRIVRHARDEAVFGRDDDVRARVRREYGYTDADRVILFLGTPRTHKGVFRLAEALEALADPRLVLCVIGAAPDDPVAARLARYERARIDVFPGVPWQRLAEIVNLADGVCLLQDPESPVSRYQLPAKLSDALATGVPVAVTDVAPFADLPAEVVTRIRTAADLRAFLLAIADDATPGDAAVRRAHFVAEHGYAENRRRLAEALAAAERSPPHWRAAWSTLFEQLSGLSGVPLPSGRPTWAGGELAAAFLGRGAPLDIAFFWKQNDTGLYGRRHDMLLRYLARHPRVGRIVQFDAPVAASDLVESDGLTSSGRVDQRNFVLANTVGRFLEALDDVSVARRVFVHRGRRPHYSFLGSDLPPLADYPDWVKDTLRRCGLGSATLSWVAPVVFDYPAVHDALGFPLCVADLIDDQRAMARSEAHRARVNESYAETLRRAHVVFANCNAMKEGFAALRPDIQVVTNAGERTPGSTSPLPRRAALAHLEGPILGYVGNLRDRIDVDLLAALSELRPDWQIVLIGSAHGEPEVLRLSGRRNVHFLGVQRYPDALDYMRMFDVAIMPHVDNAISRSMSPLKLYVYLSMGLPVVTTAVANIDEVAARVTVAEGPEAFAAAVEFHLTAGRPRAAEPLSPELCWEHRVETMLSTIEAYLRG